MYSLSNFLILRIPDYIDYGILNVYKYLVLIMYKLKFLFSKIIFYIKIVFSLRVHGRYIGKYGVIIYYMFVLVLFILLSNNSQYWYLILVYMHKSVDLIYDCIFLYGPFNFAFVYASEDDKIFKNTDFFMPAPRSNVGSIKNSAFRFCSSPTSNCKRLNLHDNIIGYAVWSDGTSYPIGLSRPVQISEQEWIRVVDECKDLQWDDPFFNRVLSVNPNDYLDPVSGFNRQAFIRAVQHKMTLPEYYIWERKFRCESTSRIENGKMERELQNLKIFGVSVLLISLLCGSSFFVIGAWLYFLGGLGRQF